MSFRLRQQKWTNSTKLYQRLTNEKSISISNNSIEIEMSMCTSDCQTSIEYPAIQSIDITVEEISCFAWISIKRTRGQCLTSIELTF